MIGLWQKSVKVRAGCCLVAGCLVAVAAAAAPGRVTVPGYESSRDELTPTTLRRSILPAYDFTHQAADELLSAAPSYRVERIDFHGHTALTDAELGEVAARYVGRRLSFRDLVALRDEVTLLYVKRGYVTSGAIIRSLHDDVLIVDVVEGQLAGIEVTSSGRFDADYLARYLRGFGPMAPVNVNQLEERLQLLQQDIHVARVDAQLLPGSQRGESLLRVLPVETDPWRLHIEANNHVSPAVGGWQGLLGIDALNLRGHGDDLRIAVRGAEGLTEYSAAYSLPVGARGTRLSVYGFAADSEIVTRPFSHLDINAESRTYGIRLSHPVRRVLDVQSSLGLSFEWRESETFLLGTGFSFVEGPDEGLARIAVLRAGWERLQRNQRNVLASRVELSVGLNAFGATRSRSGGPDGEFVKALMQLQWARRLDLLASQLVVRADAQLSRDPLLGLEQIALGGRWTVRGYRENTLIRDNAVIASVEWRIPLLRDVRGSNRLELRPFTDWSRSGNEERGELGPRELWSVGLGLHWEPRPGVRAELYWGEALNSVDYPGDYDVQDDGIHFRFSWEAR